MHAGERAEVGRHGRREEQRLPLARQLAHDLVELGLEAHVEHAVRLVEDEDADVGERDRLPLEVIDHAPGRRDDDRGASPEGAHLRAVRHAADDQRGLEAGPELLGPAVDLLGELTRRREHDGAAAWPTTARGSPQPLDERDGEGRGLAGAGLRGADDVTTGEGGLDRAGLNRRRVHVPRVAERCAHRGREFELVERRTGNRIG